MSAGPGHGEEGPEHAATPTGGSRRAILTAAAELFAEQGYNRVTIRDIAARSALSPAMVMKCGGSKRELFYEAATITPTPLPDVPTAELGETLVGELFARVERDAIEPLIRSLVLELSGPYPEQVRERFVTGYVDPLTERLGGGEDARLRAELVVSALLGLAAGVRLFRTPTVQGAPDDVVRRYGATIQRLIDG